MKFTSFSGRIKNIALLISDHGCVHYGHIVFDFGDYNFYCFYDHCNALTFRCFCT